MTAPRNFSGVSRADFFRFLALGGLLAAFTLGVNRPVLDHGWVYFDDDINIILNPHLTAGGWDTAKWAWTDLNYTRRFMPLGWMLFDGLFRAGGLNPAIFHFAGWTLAAFNSVLLFAVLRQLVSRLVPTEPRVVVDGCAALPVALLAVHPLGAEAVGWTSGLLYVAATTLALGACLAAPPGVASSPARQGLATVLFCASLLVYPVYLPLPVILAILASAARPAQLGRWAAIRRYAPWLAASVLAVAINFHAAHASAGGFDPLVGTAAYPLVPRLTNVAQGLASFLVRLFWPGQTSLFHGPDGPPWPPAWFLILLALGLTAAVARRPTRALAGASLLCAALGLLPFVRMLDPGQSPSDRYAVPMLLCAAGTLACSLAVLAGGRHRLFFGGGLVVLTVLCLQPYREALAVWRDTESVQARLDLVTADRPNPRLSFARPATVSFLRGRYEESRQRLAEGQRRFGPLPELREAERFIADLRTQLGAEPGRDPAAVPYAVMHRDLARNLAAGGHAYAAREHLRFAERLEPARGP